MGADVVEVGVVGEGVLGDQVDIAPVEFRIPSVLRRDEALAEDHVGRAEAPGIRPPKQHRMLRHGRIERRAIRILRRWCGGGVHPGLEHVVTEPVTEVVVALLVVRPMVQDGIRRQQQEEAQHRSQMRPFTPEQQKPEEDGGEAKAHQRGQSGDQEHVVVGIHHFHQLTEIHRHGDRRASADPESAILVPALEQPGDDGEPVADGEGDDDVGGGVEDLDQFARLFVGLRVEQVHEEEGEAEIGDPQSDQPSLLPLTHLVHEAEGKQGDEQVGPIELFLGAVEIGPDLGEADSGTGLLILTPGEGVDESIPGAGISPVQRGIR